MKKIILILLTLLTSVMAWADSFTLSNSGNVFTIEHYGNNTKTVCYRTVSLSAIAGKHYTETTGTLTFSGYETKTITVDETPNDDVDEKYHFQTGTTRTYRFEMLDEGGFLIDHIDRNIDYGNNYQHNTTYVNKGVTDLVYFDNSGNIQSGNNNKYLDVSYSSANWIKVTDAGYSQAVHNVSTGDLYNNKSALRSYLNSIGYKMYATVYFTQKEEKDGYQYIQILADNNSTYDGNDPDGAVNTPSTSLYKACFELSYTGGYITSEHHQFFPHRYDFVNKSAEQNAGLTRYSFDDGNTYLYEQEYKSNSYNASTSGSLILAPTVNNLNIRFDAAGNSDDDWDFKDMKVRLALVDATAPTILNNYKVSGGRHSKGNTIYVSVPFSEIVTVSGTPTLSTTWGTLTYVAGSGTNVLTFSGDISISASGTFTVNSYNGTITDLAGNTFTGTISHAFGTSMDASYIYTITYNLGVGHMPSGQSNPTNYTYETAPITLINPIYTPSNPIVDDYDFSGWTTSNNNTPVMEATIPTHSHGNIVYTAKWTRRPQYELDSSTGVLTLIYGIFNNDNRWSQNTSFLNSVRSVTATDQVRFVGDCASLFQDLENCTSMDLNSVNTSAATNMNHLFAGCAKLTSIDLSGWDTGNVTNMYGLFMQCNNLTSLNLSGWDTHNVTDMSYMFIQCKKLSQVTGLSSFNTANVTNMRYMFAWCEGFTSLDLSSWDTGNVNDLESMFHSCHNLSSLNVSTWNLAKASSFKMMFCDCTSLTSLDISNWNTANVTNMNETFASCPRLNTLDLTSWNTANVNNTSVMFYNCSSLTKIIVGPGWNMENVSANYSYYMFQKCYNLVGGRGTTYDANHIDKEYARIDGGPDSPGYLTDSNALPRYTYDSTTGTLSLNWGEFNKDNKWGDDVDIQAVTSVNATSEVSFTGDCSALFYNFSSCESMDLSSVNTSEMTSACDMFKLCEALTSLDLSKWNTANVTNMASMFYNCSSLTSLDVSHFNTSNVNFISSMFHYCSSLDSLDVSTWNTSNVTNMACLFYGCTSLKSLDLSNWDTGNVTDMAAVFDNCSSLGTLNLEGWNTDNVTNLTVMFYGCSSLDTLDLSGWNTANVTNMSAMFYGCTGLTSLDLMNWDTGNVTNMSAMFVDCSNLTTIYADKDWDTGNLYTSEYMFQNCTSLVGGKGTTYDQSHVNSLYARIDGGPEHPGYFTDANPVVVVPGDVDGDGEVTTVDITAIYNYLLNGDETFITTSDVDGDGYITTGDITFIYNILLGN